MSRIVIIGNSAAAFSCCNALLEKLQDREITVISQEAYPAYKRNLLVDYLASKLEEEALFLCAPDFYAQNQIKFLPNAKVTRLDTKKQLVVLKDNQKIKYDYLVISTGRKIELPDLPGKSKEGIFLFSGLEETKKIKERLSFCQEVCIAGKPELCFRLSEALSGKDKEIKIIAKPRPEAFVPEEKKEWIDCAEISEFIGEGAELKAFKLNNGKAISATLVILVPQDIPATDFLKNTEVKTIDGSIIVDEAMHTNFANIFACGSVCRKQDAPEKEKSWEEASGEGVLVAANIANLLERGKGICQPKY